MALYLYVDNSNVWIEGRRVSAVALGMARSLEDASRRDILDMNWTYDFGCLYRFVCESEATVGRTALFGSTPPPADTIWDMARSEGFEVFLAARNIANHEKEVDSSIGTLMLEDSYEYMKPGDQVTLVAGDRDHCPFVRSLERRGFPVTITFWSNASRDLIEDASDYVMLDDHLIELSRYS